MRVPWAVLKAEQRERDIQAVVREHITKIHDTLRADYQLTDLEIIRRIKSELPEA